jgi:hypothetical protein
VKFVLDGKLPLGASHHQKAIVIDDALAFCDGGSCARASAQRRGVPNEHPGSHRAP